MPTPSAHPDPCPANCPGARELPSGNLHVCDHSPRNTEPSLSDSDREWWENRGKRDAREDRRPLFWKTVSGWRTAGEPPYGWTEQDERETAEAYCRGYETVSS
jgi:hypothetical protein